MPKVNETINQQLQSRARSNIFYKECIKLLGKHNFHLHRPEFAPHGGIKLLVKMDTRQGVEETIEFLFPAKLNGFDSIRFREGLVNDIQSLLDQGYRPPRAQFDAPKVVVDNPKPSLAEDIFKKPEPKPEPIPMMTVQNIPGEDEDMAVMFSVKSSQVKLVLEALEGSAKLLRIRPLKDLLVKKPKPVEPTPKPVVVDNIFPIPKTKSQQIIDVMNQTDLSPKEIYGKLRELNVNIEYVTVCSTLYSLAQRNKIVRSGHGLYRRAK